MEEWEIILGVGSLFFSAVMAILAWFAMKNAVRAFRYSARKDAWDFYEPVIKILKEDNVSWEFEEFEKRQLDAAIEKAIILFREDSKICKALQLARMGREAFSKKFGEQVFQRFAVGRLKGDNETDAFEDLHDVRELFISEFRKGLKGL